MKGIYVGSLRVFVVFGVVCIARSVYGERCRKDKERGRGVELFFCFG